MTAILRFALPATIYWLHGGLMQHLLLPVNIQLSKIIDSRAIGTGWTCPAPTDISGFLRFRWWAWIESNYRPHPYQGCALAN